MNKIFLKLKDEKGQNLVEFAFALVVFLLLMYGIIEFGRGWWHADVLKNIANTAARAVAIQQNMTSAVIKPYTSNAITITFDFSQPDSVTATASETFKTIVPSFPFIREVFGGTEGIRLERDATYRRE